LSHPIWTLVARIQVIPWTLVAQTRKGKNNPTNSLRDKSPN
jgi:hypothetical protein